MSVDLDDLERLARAVVDAENVRASRLIAAQTHPAVEYGVQWQDYHLSVAEHTEAKLAFQAAASPSVVLALIAELRAARAVVEAAREWYARSASGYCDGDLDGIRWALDALPEEP